MNALFVLGFCGFWDITFQKRRERRMEKSVESLFLIAGLHFAKEFGAARTDFVIVIIFCVSLPPKTALCRPMKVLQKNSSYNIF